MFLYPKTITSLRHDWTHPAFMLSVTQDMPAPVSQSEKWLREYADGLGLSLGEILDSASDYLKHDQYLSQGDRFEGVYLPDEFWTHYEIHTGTKVEAGKRGSFFSCSC